MEYRASVRMLLMHSRKFEENKISYFVKLEFVVFHAKHLDCLDYCIMFIFVTGNPVNTQTGWEILGSVFNPQNESPSARSNGGNSLLLKTMKKLMC